MLRLFDSKIESNLRASRIGDYAWQPRVVRSTI